MTASISVPGVGIQNDDEFWAGVPYSAQVTLTAEGRTQVRNVDVLGPTAMAACERVATHVISRTTLRNYILSVVVEDE